MECLSVEVNRGRDEQGISYHRQATGKGLCDPMWLMTGEQQSLREDAGGDGAEGAEGREDGLYGRPAAGQTTEVRELTDRHGRDAEEDGV